MNLVLIIPTLKQGGAERVMSELANEFVNQGHLVHLILLTQSNDFYNVNTNVRIHRLEFQNKNKIPKIFLEVSIFYKLRKLLKNINPDATLSFMDKYNILTLAASRGLNLKVFVSDRSNPNKIIPQHILIGKKIFYRHATGIVAQTSLAKEILEILTKNKNIKVISNPVKEVLINPNITKENIIFNVGRLIPQKGQKYLIAAFNKISHSNWKLVILGDGPLRNDLKNQVKELGIEDQVLMPGSVIDVDSWYSKASIFAFSSISEGFPNALLEAMASGLPCVSFDCDAGPRDIIDHGRNGFVVKLRDVDGLTAILNDLINNEDLRKKIGQNAIAVRDTFEIKKIGKEYLDFFEGK